MMGTQATFVFRETTFDPVIDRPRLDTLRGRVQETMKDGCWHKLSDLALCCGGSEAGVSARIRELRRPEYGGHNIIKRRVANGGLWEYKFSTEVK